jgi:hypothetical protein
MMCAFQIIAKAAATALLAATNISWLLLYILADHSLHLSYRVARRDLIFYSPMPTKVSYLIAPIFRVMFKVLTDTTGSPIFRLPLLGGGSYWLFNIAMSQASVFICVHLYTEYAVVGRGGAEKIDRGTLWAGAGCLATAWFLTFSYFVVRMAVPKYRRTLWSWTSGRQVVHQYFREGKDDEAKFAVFRRNLLLWDGDIGHEVRAWTFERWASWDEEKPAWFTPSAIATCPDKYVPPEFLAGMGNRKRRGSAAGSVRESFREAGGARGEE